MSTINTGELQTPEESLMISALYGLAVSPPGYAIAKSGPNSFSNVFINGGSGTPAGLNTQVQYNNGGVMGANSGFTYNGFGSVTLSANLNADRVFSSDGLVSNPSIAFTTATGDGLYHTGTGASGSILAAINGVQATALTASDLILSVALTGGTAAGSYLSYKSTTAAGTSSGIAHQWVGGTNGGTVIATMLNNGNVGIGTVSPVELLEISGGATSSIKITSTASPIFRFYSTNGNAGTRNWALETNVVQWGDFDILQSNALGGDPRMAGMSRFHIDNNGNVGIGTASPNYRLEVQGADNYEVISWKNTEFGVLGTLGRATDGFYNSGALSLYRSGSLTVYLAAHGDSYINTGGKFGIETASPFGKLQIGSSIGENTNILSNEANIFGGYSVTRPTLNLISTSSAATDRGGSIGFSGENGQATTPYIFGQIKGAKDVAGTYGGYLSFFTTATNSAINEWMRITSGGNVGIGVTAPNAKLVVAGSTVIGTAALATDATDGFLYIPTCAGTPTGVPTAQTGTVPLVFDTTNHRLYIYDNGTWA